MSKLFDRRPALLLTLALVAACTPTSAETSPKSDGAKQPTAAAATKITVASVQMIQDCPDTEPAEPAAPAAAAKKTADIPAMQPPSEPSPGSPAQPYIADEEPGGSINFVQPCDQSMVHLALETSHEGPVTVEIRAVRVLSDGKLVGTVETRKPKRYEHNNYVSWDEVVSPGARVNASYKLSLPDWSAVEKKIGKSSFGHMFTLELDVAVDGEIRTISSPEFPREEPHVVVT